MDVDDNVINLDLARFEREFDYVVALSECHMEAFEILQQVVRLEPTKDNLDLIIRTRKLIRQVKRLK